MKEHGVVEALDQFCQNASDSFTMLRTLKPSDVTATIQPGHVGIARLARIELTREKAKVEELSWFMVLHEWGNFEEADSLLDSTVNAYSVW